MALCIGFKSMILIFFKEILAEDSPEVTLSNFLKTINVGALEWESIGQNVCLKGLTHAFNMEEMPTVVQAFKRAIIEPTITNIAKHLLILSFLVFIVHLLL